MGVLSNRDLEKKNFDREESSSSKKIPKYDKAYKSFRQKYKLISSHTNVEPKGSDKDIEDGEKELEI